MKLGVCKEIAEESDKRVAIVPEIAKRLLQMGIQVFVETGAGIGGGFSAKSFMLMGCDVLPTAQEIYDACSVLVKIR